jgi:hypothetical protein
MLRGLLAAEGCKIGRRQVRTLMTRMGIEALYRRPRTTTPEPGHKIYPYLLRGIEITRPNQVWAMDLTYIPMARGFVYLAVVLDWFSRRVLSWRLSWNDAKTYVDWLSNKTGKTYRLLTEAEYDTQRAPERKRPIPGETTSGRTTPIATAAAASGTTNRRLRSAPSPPTASVSTTWWATSGNGRRIVGTATTTGLLGMAPPGPVGIAVAAWSAAVPGTSFRWSSARPSATGTPPSTGTSTWASGLGGRSYLLDL